MAGPASQLRGMLPVMRDDFGQHLAARELGLRRAAHDSQRLPQLLPSWLRNRAIFAADLPCDAVAGQSEPVAEHAPQALERHHPWIVAHGLQPAAKKAVVAVNAIADQAAAEKELASAGQRGAEYQAV